MPYPDRTQIACYLKIRFREGKRFFFIWVRHKYRDVEVLGGEKSFVEKIPDLAIFAEIDHK